MLHLFHFFAYIEPLEGRGVSVIYTNVYVFYIEPKKEFFLYFFIPFLLEINIIKLLEIHYEASLHETRQTIKS